MLEDTSEYDNILKYVKPKNKFLRRCLNEHLIKYEDFRRLVKLLKTGNDWKSLSDVFYICFKIDSFRFFKEGTILEFYQARNYIFDYVDRTLRLESNLLQSIGIDVELWKAAGGDRLNKHSNMMPLIQLGEVFGIYPYDLASKPYMEILVLLVALKERGEVNQQFSKLKSKIK